MREAGLELKGTGALCQVTGEPIPVQLLLRVTSVPCLQLGHAGFSRNGLAQRQDQLLKPV